MRWLQRRCTKQKQNVARGPKVSNKGNVEIPGRHLPEQGFLSTGGVSRLHAPGATIFGLFRLVECPLHEALARRRVLESPRSKFGIF